MELDLGKLFIGGISWDTNEDRLREYFSSFGEVVEVVIMKDRTTGRARGFGFVVFADPGVAERVILEKHMIDGRMVEAKKAVPRDDQNITSRSTNSLRGSPGPGRSKKIFVGGLASTVTETEFKNYFDQFGTITDVVVMYDHNTQRPRGFGFITFDLEDAVDKVLVKTFHDLNGKMVEVKRAVPKELSPGPSMRSIVGGYNYGSLNRDNNFLNGYAQGYNPSGSIGGYGMRIDGKFSPIASGRNIFPSFAPGYGIDMNFEPGVSPNYGGNPNFSNGVGYERVLSPYYSGNSNRYTSSPIGYSSGNNNSSSVLNSVARNLWGNSSLNYTTNSSSSNSFMPTGSGFGNNSLNWGDSNFGLGISSYARNTGGSPSVNTSFATEDDGYERNLVDTYKNSSIYGDTTWQAQSSEIDETRPFGYGLGNASSDVAVKTSSGFIGSYSVANRQPNRGLL